MLARVDVLDAVPPELQIYSGLTEDGRAAAILVVEHHVVPYYPDAPAHGDQSVILQ